MRTPKYTDEELLQMIREKAEELGRTPSWKDMKQGQTLVKRFGSWNRALERADVPVVHVQNYTDEELLQIIRDKADELGKTPSMHDLKQGITISKRFGSWNEALKKAGLPVKKHTYTDEELLQLLRDKAGELHRPLVLREVKQAPVLIKRFGSWNKALEKAGLTVNRRREVLYTDEELLQMLKDKADDLGRSPTNFDLKQSQTVIKRFGTWNKALKKAGLSLNHSYTDEELLQMIRDKAKELGRTLTVHDLKQSSTISRRFGSWNEALKKAGLPLNRDLEFRTDEELLQILREESGKLNRILRTEDVREYQVIMKRFGSWSKAMELAGLPYSLQRIPDEELLGSIWEAYRETNQVPKAKDLKYLSTIKERFGSVEEAMKLVGLHYEPHNRKIPDEELLESIREAYRQTGQVPKVKDLKHQYAIKERFGSIAEAVKLAGLQYEPHKQKIIADEELLQDIRDAYKEKGGIPKITQLKRAGHIKNRFGTYIKALLLAGFETKELLRHRHLDQNELREIVLKRREQNNGT